MATKIEKEQLSSNAKSCEKVLFRNSSAYITFSTPIYCGLLYDKIFVNLCKSDGGRK